MLAPASESAKRRLARAPIRLQLEGNKANRLEIEAVIRYDTGRMFMGVDVPDVAADFAESAHGPLRARLPIKAGSSGQLTFHVDSTLYIKGEDDSPSKVAVVWEFSADRYGNITITRVGRPQVQTDVRGRARLGLVQVDAGIDEKHKRMAIGLDFRGASISKQESTLEKGRTIGTPEVKLGGEKEGIKGEVTIPSIPIWQGDDKTKSEQKSFVAPIVSRDFIADFVIYGAEAPPAPRKSPPPPRMRPNQWRVRFGFNDSEISADERYWLGRWWNTLQATTREQIAEDKLVLRIDSFADTPGTVLVNDDIADRRQRAVETALLREVGVKVKWGQRRPLGESEYGTDDPKQQVKEPALRQSVISVDELELVTVNEVSVQQVRDEADRRYLEYQEALRRQAERRAKASAKNPTKTR